MKLGLLIQPLEEMRIFPRDQPADWKKFLKIWEGFKIEKLES